MVQSWTASGMGRCYLEDVSPYVREGGEFVLQNGINGDGAYEKQESGDNREGKREKRTIAQRLR